MFVTQRLHCSQYTTESHPSLTVLHHLHVLCLIKFVSSYIYVNGAYISKQMCMLERWNCPCSSNGNHMSYGCARAPFSSSYIYIYTWTVLTFPTGEHLPTHGRRKCSCRSNGNHMSLICDIKFNLLILDQPTTQPICSFVLVILWYFNRVYY